MKKTSSVMNLCFQKELLLLRGLYQAIENYCRGSVAIYQQAIAIAICPAFKVYSAIFTLKS